MGNRNGTAVAATLYREVGTTEVPWGSNWGYKVSQYIRFSGIGGPIPWCGTGPKWGYGKAGVNDHGLPSPSVAVTVDRARSAGYRVSPGGANLPPGAMLAKYGVHIATIHHTTSPGYGYTVGFNENQGVRYAYRRYADWSDAIVPPSIRGPIYEIRDVSIKTFWIHDPKVFHRGPWLTRAGREAKIAEFLKGNPQVSKGHIVRLRLAYKTGIHKGKLGYGFKVGAADQMIGPWLERPGRMTERQAKEARDNALPVHEKRRGHKLIPVSRQRIVKRKVQVA